MNYKIVFTKKALKDWEKILASPLKEKTAKLLNVLKNEPYSPPYEKLTGDLEGVYSRRINIQHRLIYRIDEETKSVIILRMWTHYGDN